MRRTPDNGGAVSFRAWAEGSVVYEARVYAGGVAISGEDMHVEEALFHVIADGEDKEDSGFGQHVLIGGVEVWGQHACDAPICTLDKGNMGDMGAAGVDEERKLGVGSDDDSGNAPVLPYVVRHIAKNLRFVFVARYLNIPCFVFFLSIYGNSPAAGHLILMEVYQ